MPDGTAPPSLGAILTHLVENPRCVRFLPEERRFQVDLGARACELGELVAHVRRLGARVAAEADIAVSPGTLAAHRARFFTADEDRRYRINAAGLYRTQGKGNRTDEGVAGDALSLRHYTSFFFYPMNAFYRLDFSSPEAIVDFTYVLCVAARNFFRVPNVTTESEIGRNVIALFNAAQVIEDPGDPALCRLLQEQLIHNLMAHRCLLRQEAFRPEPDASRPLYRITDLPEPALQRYRSAAADPAAVLVEDAFTSTSPDEAQCDRHSRLDKRYKFIITPRARGTAARWLNGQVDSVVNFENEVLFPPGARFRVTGLAEHVAGDTTRDGSPRTWIFLEEG